MNFLRSIVMAFSMFSILPTPRIEWKSENMRYMLGAFPLVGVVIALAEGLWFWLCEFLNFGTILLSAGLTLIPLAITGGIHMDGFCDTTDALASHAAPEKKRQILKDPHAGAFAIIAAAAYILAYFALCCELERSRESIYLLSLVPVLSRCSSGFASTAFSTSSSEGLLKFFHDSSSRATGILLAILWLACSGALIWLNMFAGCVIAVIALLCMLFIYRLAKKEFGGMSGDIAGYLLQIIEVSALAALILVQKVVAL